MAIFRLGVHSYQGDTSPKLTFPSIPSSSTSPTTGSTALRSRLPMVNPQPATPHKTPLRTPNRIRRPSKKLITMTGAPMFSYFILHALGLRLTFHDWWNCSAYLTFSEMIQHSGVRVHVSAPSTLAWLLQCLDMDLVPGDHDLYHRRRWKKAHTYGKQTRA